MNNILITGANGQLGRELRDRSSEYKEFNYIFTDIEELDITNTKSVSDFFAKNSIDVVINCAAYTNVDKAEDEPNTAMLLNANAPAYLAKTCEIHHARMIHISTDYVFDGKVNKPYTEEDATDPQGTYAKTKREGELSVLNNTSNGLVIRTSWLYSPYNNNFMKTILRISREKNEIKVVNDQVGAPTYAGHLADALLHRIVPRIQRTSPSKTSIYHFCNEGFCSWFVFAKEIVELSGNNCNVLPITTAEYPMKSPRPAYSVLDNSKIKQDFCLQIPDWKAGLKEAYNKMQVLSQI
ncbi:MAG: dTDP-4-dehydrorhamnose reductase [Bacteroidota bacterium]